MRTRLAAIVACLAAGWATAAAPQGQGAADERPVAEQALLQAAEADRADIAAYALEKGAPVDSADRRGNTALAVAAKAGAESVAKLLLSRVDAPARDGWTALEAAAMIGDEAIVALLRAHSAKE
ncbi:MAG: ankyrin repeat domain-containing protein [Alphaproteobacteria bacterium]|nr:ankyrin repeat domain-containing protein [Alphaproteobacteria bacterium]